MKISKWKKIKKFIVRILILVTVFNSVPIISSNAANTYTINGVNVRYDNFSSSKDECWAYANNFYNKIWGQRFNALFNDSANSLRNLNDSELTLTQEHLKKYVSNAPLGSVLRICSSDYLHGSDGWGHSQIIVQKDNNGFTVFEGGLSASPYCREKYYTWSEYCNTGWLGGTYGYIKYVKWPGAPAFSDDTTPPTITNIRVTDISNTGYTVTCTVSDNAGVTRVAFPTWPSPDDSGQPVWHEGTISGNKATCKINVSEHGNKVNTNYVTHIYAYDAVGNSGVGAADVVYIDAQPPVITDVTVSDVSSNGYTITCTVSDDVGVTNVTFPTWPSPDENGQPVWHEGTISGNKATCRINVSDHGNKTNMNYITHIYAYDAAGNSVSSAVNPIFVGETQVEEHEHYYTEKITKQPTCTSTGIKTFTCSCEDAYTESIPATGHNYSNGSCTNCGETDPDYKPPVSEDTPQIIVESKSAFAGDSVDVTIALKNNPGIASMKLKVAFDSMLTLENISYNSSIGGQSQQPQSMTSPVTLNWYNGSADSEGDWTFATLTFKVSEDAEANETANVTVTYNADDVYDISETNVDFEVQNGTVTISDYLPGDINGDGAVNNKDLTRLFQYLSDWDVEVVDEALDVNGDGSINNKDQTRLFQYLSDWDVVIY